MCVSLSLGLLGRLCFGCTVVSLGLVLSVHPSLPPSITFGGCTAVFLALNWFCLSVSLPSLCSPRSPLLAALLFFEKGLSECGSIVYALSCLICK